VPSVTESLFDLGVGDRLVGITDYCVHPADQVAGLPRIGGTKNPDVERIVSLAPDLVIANQEENTPQAVEALRSAGIAVWVTFPISVRDAFNLLWNIMHVFDEAGMVERVRAMEWTCDWLERRAGQLEHPFRVFAPIWHDPWMSFSGETFASDMIRVCGGENVFSARERRYPLAADLTDAPAEPSAGRDIRYPRLSTDEIVAAQPEVIFLPDEPFMFTETHAQEIIEWDVPAAKAGRVHLIDGSLLTWHGTRMARAFDVLPGLLEPE
jgi:ABC-type Fe3+-hydroxamate transport system substrate-binding protein